MAHLDSAGELLRLAEHYRSLTDGELLDIAEDTSELTPIAQQALSDEMSQRRLKLAVKPPPPKPEPFLPTGSEFDEDRAPLTVCTVWSQRDALKVQSLLDTAGIPFYMGPENATGVDQVTSNIAEGVDVKIMTIGLPWARQVLQDYEPLDEPESEKISENQEPVPVRCPKCRSEEVIFEELEPPADATKEPPKFKWVCDSCGNEWIDDGVANEA
ncbi:MAG TPA: hypothetical protein VMH04_17880 [Candidatus Solibacter sp.]|nr:hypothetical protein [Candidatus Solibacter sp.]